MKYPIFAAILAACLSACAGVPAEATAEEADVEKVCREAPMPGSNIIKRECLTAKQWAIRDEEDRARNVGLYDNSKQDGNPATM
jgi:hypothetical protein